MALIQSKKDEHQLTFDDIKHRYILDGNGVPGVTTFIKGGFPISFQLVNWMIGQGADYTYETLIKESTHEGNFIEWPDNDSKKEIIKSAKVAYKKAAEEAAGIGTVVHDYAYLVETGKQREALVLLAEHEDTNQWDRINSAVKKFDEWKKQNESKILALEEIVASPTYQFGGKFDRLDHRNGRVILPDYKTSNGFYIDQFIQLAAYAIAIEEWKGIKVEGLEILRFGKENGEFETLLIDNPLEIQNLKEQAIFCRATFEFSKIWGKDKRFAFGGK